MDALKQAIEHERSRYAAANPRSQAADREAQRYLPGGNTRTVLHYDPFPLTVVSGEGAEVTDLDGHRYSDFVGEYSAGLFGHSEQRVHAAVKQALDSGIVMGGPTENERRLARLLCERFPAIDQLRFCNSGTEANVWALTAARLTTGRSTFLAFRDAYHGGFLKFPGGHCKLNLPLEFILADYNDAEGAEAAIRAAGEELAAVIVEPILGAGGNIVGSSAFLETLRRATREVGALLIFDEVKTSRIGPAGMQGLRGVLPDLTTLGKYISGGIPVGAFGGSAEIMAHFDPRREDRWNHAGTFNNDVCSMAAGCAAMGDIYTPGVAQDFLEWSEAFRESLNDLFATRSVPMHANGLGSMIAIHFSDRPTERPSQITAGCRALRPLLHMELISEGVLACARGDLFLSLPMTEAHLDQARGALDRFIERHGGLVREVLEKSPGPERA
jgi:glutamate-1-semialdehyde 2,1-aminomutase